MKQVPRDHRDDGCGQVLAAGLVGVAGVVALAVKAVRAWTR